tara:strand:+ start:1639 stop:2184 length:546 start_codon:yes stop_codon:yes gene_type:complete
MNRYQFEDLISEYIENELSLSKRKEFEAYLDENPDGKELVESIRSNIAKMKTIPKEVASSDFNDRLLARIHSDHTRHAIPIISQRTIFGFTPIYASLMIGLMTAFVFLSMQLVSPKGSGIPSPTQFYVEDSVPSLLNQPLQNVKNRIPDMADADADADSSSENNKIKSKKDFSKKMHFVND